jgi:hypothetical protein
MVKYPEDGNLAAPSITGALISQQSIFIPWQPGTWPSAPRTFDSSFHDTVSKIFRQSMVDELRNVVRDIQTANPGAAPFSHRGHVVAVACVCALDAISLYGYKNRNVKKFIRNHFPHEYRPYASRIYPDYRHNFVHAWNLFGSAALLPGREPISEQNGRVSFGLLNFVDAFDEGVEDFLSKMKTDDELQQRALYRYRVLTGEIKPETRGTRLPPAVVGFVLGVGTALVFESLRRR